MPNKNYIAGAAFEARFLASLLKKGHAVKGGRFYASKGITDIWWVDKNGVHHEAQLKYSAKRNPYITNDEMQSINEFAAKMNGVMKVWLVKKQSRNPVEMELIS